MKYHQSLLLTSFAFLLCGGCASIEDWHFRNVNRVRAHMAWHDTSPNIKHSADVHFARGWRDGYFEVSTGASGQLPVVPPKTYWGTKYQSGEGRRCVENYYAGWECGAIAAQSQCRPQLNAIPAKVPMEEPKSLVNSYRPCLDETSEVVYIHEQGMMRGSGPQ